jgi:hypothetical protein
MDTITDAEGRRLLVREPGIREKMKLIRALGPAADIQVYIGQVMLAACVIRIDDVPLPMPSNPDMADATVEKVGKAGMDAVGEWYSAKTAAEKIAQDRAKNSQGTPTS